MNCTGKILLKSITNHQDQNGISLSSKVELPANLSEFVSQYKKISNLFVFVCFVFIPTEAISVSHKSYKLQICSELTSSIERIFSFLEDISELSHVYTRSERLTF